MSNNSIRFSAPTMQKGASIPPAIASALRGAKAMWSPVGNVLGGAKDQALAIASRALSGPNASTWYETKNVLEGKNKVQLPRVLVDPFKTLFGPRTAVPPKVGLSRLHELLSATRKSENTAKLRAAGAVGVTAGLPTYLGLDAAGTAVGDAADVWRENKRRKNAPKSLIDAILPELRAKPKKSSKTREKRSQAASYVAPTQGGIAGITPGTTGTAADTGTTAAAGANPQVQPPVQAPRKTSYTGAALKGLARVTDIGSTNTPLDYLNPLNMVNKAYSKGFTALSDAHTRWQAANDAKAKGYIPIPTNADLSTRTYIPSTNDPHEFATNMANNGVAVTDDLDDNRRNLSMWGRNVSDPFERWRRRNVVPLLNNEEQMATYNMAKLEQARETRMNRTRRNFQMMNDYNNHQGIENAANEGSNVDLARQRWLAGDRTVAAPAVKPPPPREFQRPSRYATGDKRRGFSDSWRNKLVNPNDPMSTA